jgi:HAE1 family hydrophobic/amphiphilic exporter-1
MPVLLLLVLAINLSVLWAQQPDRPAAPAVQRTNTEPMTPPRVGVGMTQRKLSLEDAIAMALENNLDVEIERTNRDTAEQAVTAARGFFDPVFRWQPLLQTLNTPAGSVLQSSTGKLTDRTFVNNLYLNKKLENWGTQLSFGFENGRQSTTNPFTSFNPFLTTRLAFNFTQPLWRGFQIDRDRAELLIRQKRVDASSVDLELRVIDVVSRVQQAYWNLVAARQDVTVEEDSVRLAREQLAINERFVKSGTLAPVELAAAEAELQRRIDTWYTAVGILTQAENALKLLLAPERQAAIWNDEILPTDVKVIDAPAVDSVRDAVAGAVEKRAELRRVGVQQQVNDIEKKLNRNLTKPEVNLIAQYSLSGLGGSAQIGDNPFSESNILLYRRLNELSISQGLSPLPAPDFGGAPPDFLVGGYGTSLSNLFSGRFQSFQAGLSLDFNLRNRTAESNYGQSLIAEKRLRLERIRTEQAIEAQVRNALQGIETSKQRILAAEASVRAAKEKLDSEMRLFQTGESTNFLVLTRQNEYAVSRRREVLARLDFNKSVAELEQALGTTLSTHKIAFR